MRSDHFFFPAKLLRMLGAAFRATSQNFLHDDCQVAQRPSAFSSIGGPIHKSQLFRPKIGWSV